MLHGESQKAGFDFGLSWSVADFEYRLIPAEVAG